MSFRAILPAMKRYSTRRVDPRHIRYRTNRSPFARARRGGSRRPRLGRLILGVWGALALIAAAAHAAGVR